MDINCQSDATDEEDVCDDGERLQLESPVMPSDGKFPEIFPCGKFPESFPSENFTVQSFLTRAMRYDGDNSPKVKKFVNP
jgi:hypothetical protein